MPGSVFTSSSTWGSDARLAAPRAAGALQIRRVAVDELRALEHRLAEEPVRAAVDELNAVVALELAEWS